MERQPYAPISRPPRETPSAGAAKNARPAVSGTLPPAPSVAPPCPMSRPIASGTRGAPARPCTTRKQISMPASALSAHAAEEIVNRARLAAYVGTRPKRLARYDVAARPIARASR